MIGACCLLQCTLVGRLCAKHMRNLLNEVKYAAKYGPQNGSDRDFSGFTLASKWRATCSSFRGTATKWPGTVPTRQNHLLLLRPHLATCCQFERPCIALRCRLTMQMLCNCDKKLFCGGFRRRAGNVNQLPWSVKVYDDRCVYLHKESILCRFLVVLRTHFCGLRERSLKP